MLLLPSPRTTELSRTRNASSPSKRTPSLTRRLPKIMRLLMLLPAPRTTMLPRTRHSPSSLRRTPSRTRRPLMLLLYPRMTKLSRHAASPSRKTLSLLRMLPMLRILISRMPRTKLLKPSMRLTMRSLETSCLMTTLQLRRPSLLPTTRKPTPSQSRTLSLRTIQRSPLLPVGPTVLAASS